MRARSGAILAALLTVVAASGPARGEPMAAEAATHIRKACEAVWSGASEHQTDRCIQRAMAALADENRLRDNELKRLLVDSEQELKSCKEELLRAHTNAAASDVADARREPESNK